LINSVFNLIYTLIDHTYPEISDEELDQVTQSYIKEENESEKKYLEAVVKPEKFDLNKDRKFSRNEIKEAIFYVTYPKEQKKIKHLPEFLDQHVKNNVDIYVKNIKLDFLNKKQFQFLIQKINVKQFMNFDSLESKQDAIKESRLEGEHEL